MSAPEEIAPGIWGVDLGFVNAFFVSGDVVTLVDTGIRTRAARILAAVREAGRDPKDVAAIALTHHHFDHTGGLSRLRVPGTRVFAHPLDAQVVRGERRPPPPNTGPVLRALFAVSGLLFTPAPDQVDVEVGDGAEIDASGLRAVHTPGHTMGHLAFLHEGARVLFVGDAARNVGRLANTPRTFAEDMEEAKRTIAKIASLDFDVAVFGHGRVLRGRANSAFRRLADELAGG